MLPPHLGPGTPTLNPIRLVPPTGLIKTTSVAFSYLITPSGTIACNQKFFPEGPSQNATPSDPQKPWRFEVSPW